MAQDPDGRQKPERMQYHEDKSGGPYEGKLMRYEPPLRKPKQRKGKRNSGRNSAR